MLAVNIMMINPQVQEFVIKKLMFQIQKLANIATYHRRKILQPTICDREEVDLQIFKLQSHVIEELKKFKDPSGRIGEETKIKSFLPEEALEDLGLNFADPNP